MISSFKDTKLGRGNHIYGAVLFQSDIGDTDISGSVLFGNYAEIDVEDSVIQINPRLTSEESFLEFQFLSPFEVTLLFSDHLTKAEIMHNAKHYNSELAQMSFMYADRHCNGLSLSELVSTLLHKYPFDHKIYQEKSPNIQYDNRHMFDHCVFYRDEMTNQDIMLLLGERTNSIIGFGIDGVLYTDSLQLVKKHYMFSFFLGNTYSREGKHMRTFPNGSKWIKSVEDALISRCYANTKSFYEWEFEGSEYSIRVSSDFEFENAPNVPALFEIMEQDELTKITIWDEIRVRPLGILYYFYLSADRPDVRLDVKEFGSSEDFNKKTDTTNLPHALYSLIFREFGDAPKLRGRLVRAVEDGEVPYYWDMYGRRVTQDLNFPMKSLMLMESVRQFNGRYIDKSYESRFSNPESPLIAEIESSYAEVVNLLPQPLENNDFVERIYPLNMTLCLETDGRSYILYSPTFFKTHQPFYIFGYALVNWMEELDTPFIFDIMYDMPFKDLMLSIVLQSLKDEGYTKLFYDGGKTYGDLLDLDGFKGVRHEDNYLILEGNFLNERLLPAMSKLSAIHFKMLDRVNRAVAKYQLDEMAWGKFSYETRVQRKFLRFFS
jgi:hypothetical protein